MLQLSRASSIKRSRMSNLGGAPSTSHGVHRSHMDMSKVGSNYVNESINYANRYINYANRYINYANKYINYANKYINYAV